MRNTGIRRLSGSALTLLVASATAVAVSTMPAQAAVTPAWQKIDLPAVDDVWSLGSLDDSTPTATTRTGGGPFCDNCVVTYQLWQKPEGQAWKDVSPPGAEGVDSTTGTAANDMWAFKYNNGNKAYHWDGTAWTEKTPDNYFSTDASKALSRNDVWAAGSYRDSSAQWGPAVTHWDGQGWNITKLPSSGKSTTINAMDVKSDSDIWVAGFKGDGSVNGDQYQPYAAHWDGTKWSEVALPSSSPNSTLLYAVASNGPNDVWLGGNLYNTHGPVVGNKTGGYVLHWNGSTWKRTDVPGTDVHWVNSLAYHGGQIWAGMSSDSGKGLARWTGTSWEFVNGPNGAASTSQLSSGSGGTLYMNGYTYLARLAP
ncbi:hypothetical protein ACFV8T_19350 [Streptomyces sp. NPDC059832]|uniref:hypothetical protein n=1 Tax=unclassified Streptomyces TaxID=2593676 RepID=UPI003652B49E